MLNGNMTIENTARSMGSDSIDSQENQSSLAPLIFQQQRVAGSGWEVLAGGVAFTVGWVRPTL